jgi:uroporphyrinogen-III synthase
MNPKGTVYLVGAGPGDAGLMTLRGAELLGRAEVIVSDARVNEALLRLAPKGAEVVFAQKENLVPQPPVRRSPSGRRPTLNPAQVNELLVARASKGLTVVRLRQGDGHATGRNDDETQFLTTAGVAVEVVPGVPAAVAATPLAPGSPPLALRRVVVTRAHEQAGQFGQRLRDLGAEVLEIPVIRLEAPTRREELVDALLELNAYDWLVFTSPNGVTKFFEYFFRQFHDMRDLGGARIAAVGPATANRLKEMHLQVDLMPDEALATSIAEAFSEFESVENLRICLLRAEVANQELPKALEAMGAIVDDIACYRTVAETEDSTGASASLLERGADWLTFTSGSTVEHFHKRFDLPALLKKFPKMKVASIGPETSKVLATVHVTPTVEANPHTMEGLLDALLSQAG